MSVVPAQQIYTVSELNAVVRRMFEAEPKFTRCYVAGEISNFKHHSSGHMYFTLKDEHSRLRAVMFAGKNRSVTFRPQDGMRVIVAGSLSVFDRDGSYQMYVEEMQPDGVGALYVAFVQLKERLNSEGLFAESRKRPLPRYPQRIGVVTSPTGAVIRDICSTLRRRYPNTKVVLSPAQVQGPTAAGTLVRGIERLLLYSQTVEPIDVLIIARGGGSLEELWPFNEEVLARAIAACPIPVISAVGHETDFTISDFVADVRAATPTAAAEQAAPTAQELLILLSQIKNRAETALARRLEGARQRLELSERSRALQDPRRIIAVHRQSVDYLESQLRQYAERPIRKADRKFQYLRDRVVRHDIRHQIERQRTVLSGLENRSRGKIEAQMASRNSHFEKLVATLTALNPLAVLSRGYGVIYGADKTTVVTSVSQLKQGDAVHLRFQDGTVGARIVDEWEEDHGRAVQSRLDI
ncbi:exodeoxyribonuclease VII large subunit [Alicyclobacillus ferrooxydans]|nr:exodeoxyribonuclease VII large subunit [Alicyclobacillus ferrooxydans]